MKNSKDHKIPSASETIKTEVRWYEREKLRKLKNSSCKTRKIL